MIQAYTGVPGGGKSLHAAQEIMDAITKKGIPVLANFDVNRPKFDKAWFKRKVMGEFYYLPNDVLKPDVLVGFSKAHYRTNSEISLPARPKFPILRCCTSTSTTERICLSSISRN